MTKEKVATATPPNGTYTSGPNSGSSTWSGSFTYNDGTIVYTANGTTYPSVQNTSNGDAIVFSIGTAPNQTSWHLATPSNSNGKAVYGGTINTPGSGIRGGQQGWTATQT